MSSAPAPPSPPGSPQSTASNILTPNRKVQALLARFDDSDADTPSFAQKADSFQTKDRNEGLMTIAYGQPLSRMEDDSEEDDILPAASRSKITARLQGLSRSANHSDGNGHSTSGASRLGTADSSGAETGQAEPVMKRRLLTKRKNIPTGNDESLPSSRSSSPMLFSLSQSMRAKAVLSHETERSDSEDAGEQSMMQNSKFLALVQKHRKQRLEKEAEEEAKKAARVERFRNQAEKGRPRGSSPADDTEEESDLSENGGAKKLSKQARPTRKASKRAIEEMNRETQRISRNMQLAHQARTKKKITKDSLLARFNFSKLSSTHIATAEQQAGSSTSSSRPGSDTEANQIHDTPPTSPVQDSAPFNNTRGGGNHEDVALHASASDVTATRLDKGKNRATSEEPVEHLAQVHPVLIPLSRPQLGPSPKPSVKPPTSSAKMKRAWNDDDSDSDLEVITSKGDTKKYAAFEHLPKRKAKEAPSHLALRSLANLHGEDRKRSMNAAEVEVSLRKAARMQARLVRQQKIEELKARGVMIQTAEERQREQQEVEDLLERARQEAAEIQKREKAIAKKEGNYSKDGLDDDESEDDEDFEDDDDVTDSEDKDSDLDGEGAEGEADVEGNTFNERNLLDNEADEVPSDQSSPLHSEVEEEFHHADDTIESDRSEHNALPRRSRPSRIVSDDEDEDEDEDVLDGKLRSPQLPLATKTPQSLSRSARKQIPGLQMSDDLPIGLTQAFAATMADLQSQDMGETPEQDSLTMTADLPSPKIAMAPRLHRLDSLDVITDSQPTSQTQPLNVNLSFSESQRLPQSPAKGIIPPQFTPSQAQFEPTQDSGYALSPFVGSRFTRVTPQNPTPHSTVDTISLARETQDSPMMQRKARLRRGRANTVESDEDSGKVADPTAFDIMRRAAKDKSLSIFDKSRSHARDAVDEAAEESEDEYAGLGGASDEDVNEEENEDDRRMIDEDTQVGVGDGAKLAKLFADRQRQQDEADVSKLLKDITTGALRRKRGNDDLDLSDDEEAIVRRREAKRREFAKMRRELLKDEAVGKIAEDKRKEAFLRSIEDRPESDDEEDDFDLPETPLEEDSQANDSLPALLAEGSHQQQSAQLPDQNREKSQPILKTARSSTLNQVKQSFRTGRAQLNQRPKTLAEVRETVSFLIEEPDSQAASIDLGLSDSEEEPEAYVDLDRHLHAAEVDENAEDVDDLGDFIVDDDGQAQGDSIFKKPSVPYSETRAPFSERRTKERPNVVNRLSMLRQASSSSGSSSNTKMAFYTSSSSSTASFSNVPNLLRRATTNSSLGSIAGRDENMSATGVVTSRTERGKASDEKEFVRKGSGGLRNAVNYRPTVREEKMSQRAGVAKRSAAKAKKGGFLGGLFRGDSWA